MPILRFAAPLYLRNGMQSLQVLCDLTMLNLISVERHGLIQINHHQYFLAK